MTRAEAILRLQAGKAGLQGMGVRHLALFGSFARGDASVGSDIDLAARLDQRRSIGVLGLVQIEQHIHRLLDGFAVDLVTEPSAAPRLQAQIDRDRIDVF